MKDPNDNKQHSAGRLPGLKSDCKESAKRLCLQEARRGRAGRRRKEAGEQGGYGIATGYTRVEEESQVERQCCEGEEWQC